ncbi:MAG: hypothetical protein IJG36_05880 [Synergistaceae bacterium]|nr:hypothetical protein [Synergistaceae bacterium]MBQ3758816.1 hypothetical protein [Synergistaceae bacterium]
MELSRNEVKTVLKALTLAEYELETLHGLTVTDNPESGQVWKIDTQKPLMFIDRALSILERKEGGE